MERMKKRVIVFRMLDFWLINQNAKINSLVSKMYKKSFEAGKTTDEVGKSIVIA